jgi:hypothetical protein
MEYILLLHVSRNVHFAPYGGVHTFQMLDTIANEIMDIERRRWKTSGRSMHNANLRKF